MKIPVQVQPATTTLVPVDYRWDADTDILSAHLRLPKSPGGTTGSVDVEGSDGSWLIFDVSAGAIRGVEVAVWPTVRKRSDLAPPGDVEDVHVTFGAAESQPAVSAVEVNTAMQAEADHAERTIHFRLGPGSVSRTVRIARQMLLDIDGHDRLAGVWLLDVPPFPDKQ